ncbi:MAG: hypothetical protein ACXV74_13560 [Methylobacter sp.]
MFKKDNNVLAETDLKVETAHTSLQFSANPTQEDICPVHIKQQALYVGGIQVAGGSASKSIGYDSQPLLLGRDTENGTPNFFLQGRIDKALIYN